jgi:hypothetical protein
MDPGAAAVIVAGLSFIGTLCSLGVAVYLNGRIATVRTRVDGLLSERDVMTERAADAEGQLKGRDFVPPSAADLG